MKLTALITIDGLSEAVHNGEKECIGIATLVNISKSKVLLDQLNSTLPSEFLLMRSEFLAHIGNDVEGKLPHLKRADASLIPNDGNENLNKLCLLVVLLEIYLSSGSTNGLHDSNPSLIFGIAHQEAYESHMAL